MKVHVQVPSHLDLVPEGTVIVLHRYLVPAGTAVVPQIETRTKFSTGTGTCDCRIQTAELDRRLRGDSLLLLNFAYCSFRILQECNAELGHTAEFELEAGRFYFVQIIDRKIDHFATVLNLDPPKSTISRRF